MRNYCFNRFTLRTDNIEARRKILRWLALNYRLYEYIPSKDEVRGRFIARKPFSLAAFRHLTRTIPNDATLFLRIVSTDLYTLYLEGYVYSHGEWHAPLALTLRLRIPEPPSFLEKSMNSSKIQHYGIHLISPFRRNHGISATPRSTASLHFSPCIASIPKPFPQIFTRVRSWAAVAAIFSGSCRWLLQTSLERSSPAALAPGRTGICRNTPVRHLRRNHFRRMV